MSLGSIGAASARRALGEREQTLDLARARHATRAEEIRRGAAVHEARERRRQGRLVLDQREPAPRELGIVERERDHTLGDRAALEDGGRELGVTLGLGERAIDDGRVPLGQRDRAAHEGRAPERALDQARRQGVERAIERAEQGGVGARAIDDVFGEATGRRDRGVSDALIERAGEHTPRLRLRDRERERVAGERRALVGDPDQVIDAGGGAGPRGHHVGELGRRGRGVEEGADQRGVALEQGGDGRAGGAVAGREERAGRVRVLAREADHPLGQGAVAEQRPGDLRFVAHHLSGRAGEAEHLDHTGLSSRRRGRRGRRDRGQSRESQGEVAGPVAHGS